MVFKHPNYVCMSYKEHFVFSVKLSFIFAKASICALIHAIYPDVLITHSSDTIHNIMDMMNNIGCRKL